MRLSIRQYATGLLELEAGLEAGKAKEAAERFFAWLSRRGEEKKIERIVKEAERLLEERSGIAKVSITTAHAADAGTKDMLSKQAETVFAGKRVEATFVTDPELIGGARMQSDEVLYDMTLSSSMKKLRSGIAK